jgi:predicted dehydrogenase
MKVAILGCGAIAKAHIEPLKRLDVEVVAVCDPDEEASAGVAARFGIPRRYREAAELLDRERPDVVHVIAPPQAHRDLAVEAMEAGCHVLVEKPMAVNAAEADEMIEAARRCERTLGVCHTMLFDSAVATARELAATGELGDVLGVETRINFHKPEVDRTASNAWIRDLRGGVINEIGPHPVYLHRAFLGDLTVFSALSKPTAYTATPVAEFLAMVEGEAGMGSIALSYAARPRLNVMRVYGTKMGVYVDILNHIVVRMGRDTVGGNFSRTLVNLDLGARLATRAVTATASGLRRPWMRGHDKLIQGHYAALRDGADPPVTGEDGRAVVAVLDQLWDRLEASEPARASTR